jgi:hypothetical protein
MNIHFDLEKSNTSQKVNYFNSQLHEVTERYRVVERQGFYVLRDYNLAEDVFDTGEACKMDIFIIGFVLGITTKD